jgi:signal peptidase I
MNKFFEELKSILIILAAVFVFRSSVLNWYVIPSGSLLPTLKIGDHVVVNKLSYGVMLPFMENRIFSWDQPKRGDVVVFKGPESDNGITLIKRVVGLPGDTVSFTNGVLTINGVVAKEELLEDLTPFENMGGNETGDGFNLYLESGFSKQPHYIMRRKWGGMTEAESQSWVVPAHKLLLIGDNRDNSADGRIWGFMDESRIYGRAFLISYSTYDVADSWLPKLRNDRWFIKITN